MRISTWLSSACYWETYFFKDSLIVFTDLCDYKEVPQLDLILQQRLLPCILHPYSVLDDAHVLLRVAVNGKVHEAHLDTKCLMIGLYKQNKRPECQKDRTEDQTRMKILDSTLVQGLLSFWMNQSCSLKINF